MSGGSAWGGGGRRAVLFGAHGVLNHPPPRFRRLHARCVLVSRVFCFFFRRGGGGVMRTGDPTSPRHGAPYVIAVSASSAVHLLVSRWSRSSPPPSLLLARFYSCTRRILRTLRRLRGGACDAPPCPVPSRFSVQSGSPTASSRRSRL